MGQGARGGDNHIIEIYQVVTWSPRQMVRIFLSDKISLGEGGLRRGVRGTGLSVAVFRILDSCLRSFFISTCTQGFNCTTFPLDHHYLQLQNESSDLLFAGIL